MKNLHVFQTTKVSLVATIVGQCIDADNERILVLTSNFQVYEVHGGQLSEPTLVQHDFDGQAVGLNQIHPEDVVQIEFIVENGCILVALRSGKILCIGVSSFSPSSREIYHHPKCLSSLKLSPDQDLVALADQDNNLFIFSSDWTQIYSSNALENNDSAHKPVGVGWGSKETQFFGLDGRPSKEKQDKNQVMVDEDELQRANKIEQSETFAKLRRSNERSTVIDWRGDGQFLATLTFIPDCDKHYLKVWNRNLELQFMSEQLVTMERGLLSWIPNGQYACCAQRRDVRVNEIAMFEKNGMVHQRVSLPTLLPHLYIRELLWSPDSRILAIIVAQFGLNSKNEVTRQHMIMLYTMQNFHYYLKYTAHLAQECDHYLLRWNPIHHSILYIATDGGQCVEYYCTLTVDYCRQGSTVTAVDADKLKLTPFDICNVPPPMSAIDLKFPSLVTRFIASTGEINRSFILTIDGRLWQVADHVRERNMTEIVTCLDNKAIEKFKSSLGSLRSIDIPQGHTYQNLTALTAETLLATRQVAINSEILLLEVVNNSLEAKKLKQIENHQVVTIVKNSCRKGDGCICILLDDSSCSQLNLKTGELLAKFTLKQSNERLYIKDTQYIDKFDVVMSLTMDLNLRINEHIIASNCTSFRISDNFLVYTTADNLINFLPLDRVAASDKQSELGSWNQPIEDGGTLVLVSENDSKVILQLPRGNLETLHPRIMILLKLMNELDSGQYICAMELARRYRVDLNFLCDYLLRRDETEFFQRNLTILAIGLAQKDPSLLNLLITELSSEDTTQGRYAGIMKYLPARAGKLESSKISTLNDKVNRICKNIRLPESKYCLQPRLLCLLKQEPRATDEALKIIHWLDDNTEKEAALKFILYFVQVDQLFLDAISTYDLDIALMVATVSSRDPKEYLALLDGFKAVGHEHLRRHRMDMHTKNYEKAFSNLLEYLHESSDKEETKTQLLDLMVSKRLYKHALQECCNQLVNFVQLSAGHCRIDPAFDSLNVDIWTKYGDYLLEKRYYLEAGLAYSKSIRGKVSGDEKRLNNVIKCFLLADDWERCLAAIERFGLASPRREEVLRKISTNLLQQGEKTSAAFVLQVSKDNKLANHMADLNNWHLAEVLADAHGKEEVLRKISHALNDSLNSITCEIVVETDKAEKHFERLKEVILTPQKSKHIDAENCFTADSLSTVDGSEATSVTSGSRNKLRTARSGAPSIATRTSSKSSKSQAAKKKKINLKPGSRHEDMALAKELQAFVENQKSRQEYVKHLMAADIEYGREVARSRMVSIRDELTRRFGLAKDIYATFWPKVDHEDNVFSLYKRFGKLLFSEEAIDNSDVKLLLRPELPSSLVLLEL